MRAYELMVIIDSDVDDEGSAGVVSRIEEQVAADGATIASTDNWGRRQFAYPINKKTEGSYIVFEITSESGGLDQTERMLRLADEVVRHKVVRLPDAEATRRGLLESAAS